MNIDKIKQDLGADIYTQLKGLMARLRDKETGCPWDIEQDFDTIAPYTLEEAYEVAEAIENRDMAELRDELGDLLMQVLFHAQMADELGEFDLDDVSHGLLNKMISRHPHVFGDDHIADAEAQTANWEAVKAAERAAKGNDTAPASALDGVAAALPALLRAEKLQKRAARVGFDWPDIAPVAEKLAEEAAEIAQARTAADIEEEIGDFLFAAVNLARHHGVNPETALRRANHKFTARFQAMEALARAKDQDFKALDLDAQEALWQAVKAAEK